MKWEEYKYVFFVCLFVSVSSTDLVWMQGQSWRHWPTPSRQWLTILWAHQFDPLNGLSTFFCVCICSPCFLCLWMRMLQGLKLTKGYTHAFLLLGAGKKKVFFEKKKVRKYIIFSALFLCLYPNCLSALIYGGIILFTRGMTHYIMQLPYPAWGRLAKNVWQSSIKWEVKVNYQEVIFVAL